MAESERKYTARAIVAAVTVRSICVEVPVAKGEEVRRTLLAMDLLRKDLQIERSGDRLYIPVKTTVAIGDRTLEREFRKGSAPVRRWQAIVRVPDRLRSLLPTSLDVIGAIAILRLPDELRDSERDIGEAILKWNPKLRTVAVDEGVGGEFRVRGLRVAAGDPSFETVHTEYGLRYAVDVSKVYFSPRLGSERMRVAEQIRPAETVVDLFAGAGPYAILIARRREPRVVYAVDSNEVAVRYLIKNVRTNRAWRVEPHLADARSVLAKVGAVDRIVMDLPHTAHEFLIDAFRAVRPGGMIHYYAILSLAEAQGHREEIQVLARDAKRHAEIAATREVRGYSPVKKHWAYDLRVT